MHRPISNGFVESGQGRRLPDKSPTAHNPIRVQISSPHSCPLHEDAMLSPKRSDVAVYYFPASPVFRSTRGTRGCVLVYAWSLHRLTRCCFLTIHGNRPRAALTANCIMPDERSIDAHLLHPRASMPIPGLPLQSFPGRHACSAGLQESLVAKAISVPWHRVLDHWGTP